MSSYRVPGRMTQTVGHPRASLRGSTCAVLSMGTTAVPVSPKGSTFPCLLPLTSAAAGSSSVVADVACELRRVCASFANGLFWGSTWSQQGTPRGLASFRGSQGPLFQPHGWSAGPLAGTHLWTSGHAAHRRFLVSPGSSYHQTARNYRRKV